ncbi:hypothetical protein CD116_03415 [Staphylococcus schweitzeri]|uniref:Uncharacterized protein n=1 Tax=Staphylococcus schweitzeri TaxID=1654388 RepID=A0A2K4AKF8_9STAP|nr:hypothetical protein CD116_03415 [Staphylococcus schweitzeri]
MYVADSVQQRVVRYFVPHKSFYLYPYFSPLNRRVGQSFFLTLTFFDLNSIIVPISQFINIFTLLFSNFHK